MKNVDDKKVEDGNDLEAIKAERRAKRKAIKAKRQEMAGALEALAGGKDLDPDDGVFYEGNPMYWLPEAEVEDKADLTDFIGQDELEDLD